MSPGARYRLSCRLCGLSNIWILNFQWVLSSYWTSITKTDVQNKGTNTRYDGCLSGVGENGALAILPLLNASTRCLQIVSTKNNFGSVLELRKDAIQSDSSNVHPTWWPTPIPQLSLSSSSSSSGARFLYSRYLIDCADRSSLSSRTTGSSTSQYHNGV